MHSSTTYYCTLKCYSFTADGDEKSYVSYTVITFYNHLVMSKVNKEPAEPPAAPKPQFKKLKKKNKARRLRTRDNHNDDDNEEDTSAMEAIEQTKKKRKLLNEVLYKKGLDATAYLETLFGSGCCRDKSR